MKELRISSVIEFYEEVDFKENKLMGHKQRELLLTYTTRFLDLRNAVDLSKLGIILREGGMVVERAEAPKRRMEKGTCRSNEQEPDVVMMSPLSSRGVGRMASTPNNKRSKGESPHIIISGPRSRCPAVETPLQAIPTSFMGFGKTLVAKEKLERGKEKLFKGGSNRDMMMGKERAHSTDSVKSTASVKSTTSNKSRINLELVKLPPPENNRENLKLGLKYLHKYGNYFKGLRKSGVHICLPKKSIHTSSFSPYHKKLMGDTRGTKSSRHARQYKVGVVESIANDFACTLRNLESNSNSTQTTKFSTFRDNLRGLEYINPSKINIKLGHTEGRIIYPLINIKNMLDILELLPIHVIRCVLKILTLRRLHIREKLHP